jgi:hypothetical protein
MVKSSISDNKADSSFGRPVKKSKTPICFTKMQAVKQENENVMVTAEEKLAIYQYFLNLGFAYRIKKP